MQGKRSCKKYNLGRLVGETFYTMYFGSFE